MSFRRQSSLRHRYAARATSKRIDAFTASPRPIPVRSAVFRSRLVLLHNACNGKSSEVKTMDDNTYAALCAIITFSGEIISPGDRLRLLISFPPPEPYAKRWE